MTSATTGTGIYTLWGASVSFYTGKIRSYLIKKGVPFRELYPSSPEFHTRIVPVVGNFVVPVLETPQGEIIQDTTDMIEHFEARSAQPLMVPDTPVQRAVAWLLSAFASEGLVQASMSYRWHYRDKNSDFLRREFGRVVHAGPDRAERDQAGSELMSYFSDYLVHLGITAETVPAIEETGGELLDALDIHFQSHPYILGGRPSIADCSLMGMLYIHMARDPFPSMILKNHAPNVYCWTERMNLANIADPEFPDYPEAYLPGDEIPATLEPVLKLAFQDWGAELLANARFFNAWVAENSSLAAGHLVSADGERRIHPTLGFLDYDWRGCTVRRASAPHGLWHFDKAAAHARGLGSEARQRFDALVERCGGEQVMAIAPARPMKRENYALVLT